MATNQFRSKSANPAARADAKTGAMVDPGPYEAIITAHIKNTRMGQLRVWIPDFGGKLDDPDNQIVVSYASPFYGKTYGSDLGL